MSQQARRILLPSTPYQRQGHFLDSTSQPQIIKFSPDGMGLSMLGLKNMTVGVPYGSEPAMQGIQGSSTMNFRIVWPGYNFDMRTLNASNMNRTQLAAEVSKRIFAFLSIIQRQRVACAEDAFRLYGINECKITMPQLYLEGVINTTANCWQPIIYMDAPGTN